MAIRTMLGLFLAACLLSGCSTIQSRKQEKAESFSQLSKEQQALVMKGRIAEGMSADAVYIALGAPLRKTRGMIQGKETVTWIYGQLETYTYPTYRYSGYRAPNGTVVLTPEYYPESISSMRDSFVVFFQNGKVAGWQQL